MQFINMLDVIVAIGGLCPFRECSGWILCDIPMKSFLKGIGLRDQLSFIFMKNYERGWSATQRNMALSPILSLLFFLNPFKISKHCKSN